MISKNKLFDCYIGQGYYPTFTPSIVKNYVMLNPKWYTAYTPYQAEIAQGRLFILFNYQKLIRRITRMEVANASLLDESSAAIEAVLMAVRLKGKRRRTVMIDQDCYQSNIDVVKSQLELLDYKVEVGRITQQSIEQHSDDLIAVMLQNPDCNGEYSDLTETISHIHSHKAMAVVGTDMLAGCVLKPVGEMGADIAFGYSQRFGVPMGFGGPAAAFLTCKKKFMRQMPGRIISRTDEGQYRMALQSREQHIRREKATSNICTA